MRDIALHLSHLIWRTVTRGIALQRHVGTKAFTACYFSISQERFSILHEDLKSSLREVPLYPEETSNRTCSTEEVPLYLETSNRTCSTEEVPLYLEETSNSEY